MPKPAVETERLLNIRARLGDAVIDPRIWPEIIAEVSSAIRATGGLLLQSDLRTPDVPRTEALDELVKFYFEHGWHTHDVRAARGVPLLLGGQRTFIDENILARDELESIPFFNECMVAKGFKWAAAVGFHSGSALWGLCLHRTINEEPFNAEEARLLAALSDRLTETATLSKAVGRAVLSGMTNALHMVGHAAVALDRLGFVVGTNAAAEGVFDDDIRVARRRLIVNDHSARSALRLLTDQLRATPDAAPLPVAPIVVRRTAKRPLLIRVLPVDGAARNPFLGARALLLLSDLERKARPQMNLLIQTFGLSPTEAKIASLLAAGESVEDIAQQQEVLPNTIRMQLKSVFAKTGTGRQSELVALLSQL